MNRFWFLWALLVVAACDDTSSPGVTPDAADNDATHADAADDVAVAACTTFFGRPVAKTGLTEEQCMPSCACGGRVFEAAEFDAARLEELRSYAWDNPSTELTSDPYSVPAPEATDEVCAVVLTGKNYLTQTFASTAAAEAAGGIVTHFGACGVCSSLQDLAVYAGNGDLTTPVRQCGIVGVAQGEEKSLQCLLDLGFTRPCAQVWYYNTLNTRTECGDVCIRLLNAPYQNEDGSLNECLQCDEDKSGPVFKAVAGRTRRNSGLASALCRPCDEVRPLSHDY